MIKDKSLAKDIIESLSEDAVSDLSKYIDLEIQDLYIILETAKDQEIYKAQGGISALKKLKKIREYSTSLLRKD
jgi:hypothetical protein